MTFAYVHLGDEAGIENWIRNLKELDSADNFVDFALAFVAATKDDFEKAELHMEEALRKHPSNDGYRSSLGFYYARLGKRDKAAEMMRKLRGLPDGTFGKPFWLALIYAGLGEKDEMFRYLDLAFEEHSILFRALRYNNFDPEIREDPRYISLFDRAKLRP